MTLKERITEARKILETAPNTTNASPLAKTTVKLAFTFFELIDQLEEIIELQTKALEEIVNGVDDSGYSPELLYKSCKFVADEALEKTNEIMNKYDK